MEIDNATNPADEPEVVTEEPASEAEAPETELNEEQAAEGDATAEDEEVEYSGAKYKVPKAIAPIIAQAESLQADYTRKTQTLAESRKAYEAEVAQFRQETEITGQLSDDFAELRAIESQLKPYETVNWPAWQASNPQEANAGMARMLQLQTAHRQKYGQVEGRRSELASLQEQKTANQWDKAIEMLNKPDTDKGWDGKFDQSKRDKLTSFGKEIGYTDQELAGTNHPLMIKTLHLAQIGYEALKKSRAATAKIPKPQVEAKPVPELSKGKASPIKGLDDRLDTDEWIKRRNEQVASRMGRLRTR